MKTTVKRTLSLLLAAASMASVLTACGSKDTAAADTSANTQAASASADASDLGPVLTRIKESGEMVIATASGYMPYEFVDISSANQDVIGVDMALGDKIIEKLSDKLGVEVKKKVEDTTFTANLAAVAADQVDIMLAAVDAAADMVDVGSNPADGGSQLLLLGVIDLDDVAVNQHFSGIRAKVAGAELIHLVANHAQFLLVQADFLADGSRAVWHIETLLSQYNGHFFSKTW